MARLRVYSIAIKTIISLCVVKISCQFNNVGSLKLPEELPDLASYTQQPQRNGSEISPLSLVMLPTKFQEKARCLDGSPFGYYIRRSNSQTNSRKWILFLMGGGACITPKDCIERKASPRGWGSSTVWNSTFLPGRDYPGLRAMHDILSDNPIHNPHFFDHNHVYLQYCSGDIWTGTRNAFDRYGLWFSGHNNIQAAITHLNETENFTNATHVLVIGVSAGGWGLFNNIDHIREKLIARSAVVKGVPVDGFIPAGPATLYQFYPYGLFLPLNGALTRYLSSWWRSALDESCRKSHWRWRQHRCLDASFVFKHVDSSLFVIQNRFDKLIMEEFLRAPLSSTSNSKTRRFTKWYGDLTLKGLTSNAKSTSGRRKGHGLFVPSCLEHAGNFCINNGTTTNGRSLNEMLPEWFLETNLWKASANQEIDRCNDEENTSLPCNNNCKCSG